VTTDDEPGPIRKALDALVDLLPDGGVGNEGPAPDVDGHRDGDQAHKRAVLTTKTQQPPNGSSMTSYEGVDRGRLNDA